MAAGTAKSRGTWREQLRVWVLEHLYQAAAGIARSDDRYATLLGRHPLPLGLTATGPVKLGKAPSWKA
jgi:hypothetical protein